MLRFTIILNRSLFKYNRSTFNHGMIFQTTVMKKFLDITAIATGLIILSPMLLILCYLVRKHMGHPIFFVQKRPGLFGKPFYMYKFRTMTNASDKSGCLLPDCERLTLLGKFLRATSLDELPELFNVLKGEMNLVGPRPLLEQYLERYSPEQARRHEVKPGITGWAQINGRNAISWDEKFKLDVWYVDHRSFWLDIKIIFLTIITVFKREGVNEPGEATMTEFMGNSSK